MAIKAGSTLVSFSQLRVLNRRTVNSLILPPPPPFSHMHRSYTGNGLHWTLKPLSNLYNSFAHMLRMCLIYGNRCGHDITNWHSDDLVQSRLVCLLRLTPFLHFLYTWKSRLANADWEHMTSSGRLVWWKYLMVSCVSLQGALSHGVHYPSLTPNQNRYIVDLRTMFCSNIITTCGVNM